MNNNVHSRNEELNAMAIVKELHRNISTLKSVFISNGGVQKQSGSLNQLEKVGADLRMGREYHR
jgi:hypothetical protein